MEGKRGSECLLKSVSNIDFNPGHNRDSKGNHAKNYAVSDLQFDSECSGMTFYVYRKA
ncbi:hypothetical protein PESHB4_00260 [Pediococcus ethanolidurans]